MNLKMVKLANGGAGRFHATATNRLGPASKFVLGQLQGLGAVLPPRHGSDM